jgi:hypothetical protein
VHKAVLWSLGLVVVIELVPITALLIGAPSLSAMISSPDPIGYLLTSHGNETLSRLVSAGIFLSVFNAIVAIVIQIGRVVFSSGRDALWTPTINKLFTRIHPRWESPWLATLFLGDTLGAVELQFQPGRPHLVQRAADHHGVPGGGVECIDEPGAAARPRAPVPHAAVAVAGAAGRAGRWLPAGDLAHGASVRDIMIIIGLLALSVILYCTSGRLSPVFPEIVPGVACALVNWASPLAGHAR